MKVWTTDRFVGHYPVGTAAVVVAETQEKAYELMCEALKDAGLLAAQTYNFALHFHKEDMTELPTGEHTVVILNNGNY